MVDLLAQDKLLHALSGVVIFAGCHLFYSSPICLATVAVIGVGKEVIYDKLLQQGTPEVIDAVSTMAGGLLGFSCTIKF